MLEISRRNEVVQCRETCEGAWTEARDFEDLVGVRGSCRRERAGKESSELGVGWGGCSVERVDECRPRTIIVDE